MRFFLLFTSILFSILVNAQNTFDKIIARIDSLAVEGLPKSALAEVDKLDKLARQNNFADLQIRSTIYKMTFLSFLEENALVSIINQLKIDIDKAHYPSKQVLQSILAEIHWKYYQQNRWQFSQRSQLEKADEDFTKWDLKTIINETMELYRSSLDEKKLQHTNVNVLKGVLTPLVDIRTKCVC